MYKKTTELVIIFALPFALLIGGNANAFRGGGVAQWQAMQPVQQAGPAGSLTATHAALISAATIAYVVGAMWFSSPLKPSTDASKEVPVDQIDADENVIK